MYYYTVYKVTNKVNGKVYIGTHKTKNLDDGYMGSGKYLKHAINKHGLEQFEKEILFVYDNPEEMFAKEAELVTEDFLVEENTYNLRVGGMGGFDYINQTISEEAKNKRAISGRNATNKILKEKYGSNWKSEFSKKAFQALNKILKNDPTYLKRKNKKAFKGKNILVKVRKN